MLRALQGKQAMMPGGRDDSDDSVVSEGGGVEARLVWSSSDDDTSVTNTLWEVWDTSVIVAIGV